MAALASTPRKLLASDPLKPYYAREDVPAWDDDVPSHGDLQNGPATNPQAVVDDQFRVHGMERLRVIDASIMPAMLSANLNAATMMIGEKGADLVRGREPLRSAQLV